MSLQKKIKKKKKKALKSQLKFYNDSTLEKNY